MAPGTRSCTAQHRTRAGRTREGHLDCSVPARSSNRMSHLGCVPRACSSAAAAHGRIGRTANQPKTRRRILLSLAMMLSEEKRVPTNTHIILNVNGQAGPAMARPGRACPAEPSLPWHGYGNHQDSIAGLVLYPPQPLSVA